MLMPKYKVTRWSEIEEIWYIKADSEEEAFDKIEGDEPDEIFPVGNSHCETEIEIDDSLDEAEESDLKERKWNEELQ